MVSDKSTDGFFITVLHMECELSLQWLGPTCVSVGSYILLLPFSFNNCRFNWFLFVFCVCALSCDVIGSVTYLDIRTAICNPAYSRPYYFPFQ